MDIESKNSKKYLEQIEKELEILKDSTLANCETIHCQSEQMVIMDNKSKEIQNNVKVGKWYLNLIDATFGKLYSKMHKIPRIKYSNNSHKIVCKNQTYHKNKNFNTNSSYVVETNNLNDDPLNSICKTLEEIKEINVQINQEIGKQNLFLDDITNTTENSTDQLYKNIEKTRKIIHRI